MNGIALYQQLKNGQIDTINGAWGAVERTHTAIHLVCTFAYILLLYLFLWNLQEVENNGWASIPALMAASWALLGIEAVAVEFERPYQLHPNHFLPLGKMGVAVARNVVQTYQESWKYSHDIKG